MLRALFPGRLTVGPQTLNLFVEVQILAGDPVQFAGSVRSGLDGGHDPDRGSQLDPAAARVRRDGCADRAGCLLAQRVAQTLRDITKLRGEIAWKQPGQLPNDGKVIEDARSYK